MNTSGRVGQAASRRIVRASVRDKSRRSIASANACSTRSGGSWCTRQSRRVRFTVVTGTAPIHWRSDGFTSSNVRCRTAGTVSRRFFQLAGTRRKCRAGSASDETARGSARRERNVERKITRRRRKGSPDSGHTATRATQRAHAARAAAARAGGRTTEQLLDESGSRPTLYRHRDDVLVAGIDLLTEGSPAVWRLRLTR